MLCKTSGAQHIFFSPRNCFPQFLDQEKNTSNNPTHLFKIKGEGVWNHFQSSRISGTKFEGILYLSFAYFEGGGWVFPCIGLTSIRLRCFGFRCIPPSHIRPEEIPGSCCWPHLFVVATEQLHLVRCGHLYWIFSQFQVSDFKGQFFVNPKRKSRYNHVRTVWWKEFQTSTVKKEGEVNIRNTLVNGVLLFIQVVHI